MTRYLRPLAIAAVLFLLSPSVAVAWLTRIGGNGPGSNSAGGIVAEPAGDVIIGGRLTNLVNGVAASQATVARFAAADGAEVWRTTLAGASVSSLLLGEPGTVIAVSKVFVSALAQYELRVAKLSIANGGVLWSKTFANANVFGAATDSRHDVVLVGSTKGPTMQLAFILKIAGSSGAELWRNTLDDGLDGKNEATRVAFHVRNDGPPDDVYVAGTVASLAGFDIFAARLAGADGDLVWGEADATIKEANHALGLAVDGAGNPIIVGRSSQGLELPEIYAVKLDRDGNKLWNYNPNYKNPGTMTEVAVDSQGDVVMAGLFRTQSVEVGRLSPEHFGVVKVAGADGAERWRYKHPGTVLAGAFGLTVDAHGDAIVVGESSGKKLIFTAILAKFSGGTGIPVWVQSIPAASLFGVTTDANGVVAAVGGDDKGDASQLLVTKLVPSMLGKQITVSDNLLKPAKRKIQVSVKDTTFLVPTPGSSGDPSLTGATLVVENPTTLERVTFDLPAANWKPGKAFKYSDKKPLEGPCGAAAIKKGQWQVTCTGDQIGFTLDEASQGSLAATLTFGSERSCALFGGEVKKDFPAAGKKAGVFQAKNAPPPPACR